MATEVDRWFHPIEPRVCIEANGTPGSFGPAKGKVPAVMIATRNEIAAAGIEALLQADGYRVVARCSSEDDLLRCSEACRPDIIVLAENIVRQETAKIILRLRDHNRSVAIVFLLEERNATIADLLVLPVEGILLRTACARNFIDCVESVHHGRKWVDPDLLHDLKMAEWRPQIASTLTSREAEIARLVSQGLHNKEIARELHMSETTVKMHLRHIYRTLHVRSRTQLALSMVGVCAQTAVSGNGACPAGEPARLDSAAPATLVASQQRKRLS
jgi:DNA-binding NarL/FixJ family response regulator